MINTPVESERKPLFSLSKRDFVIQPFRASGKGGQKVNKTMSACRILHPASGAVSECQEERSFEQNKQRAFQRLHDKEKFKTWLRVEVARLTGKTALLEAKVTEMMCKKNLMVEVVEDDKWVKEESE